MQEKVAMIRANESLQQANENLINAKEVLVRSKDAAEGQVGVLTKTLEALQKDLKDRETQVSFNFS